ncbi:MarR family winged helix-turn-helix transcriptional regulator [Sodalis praecaptivus]|uniref:MarR family winged helix-turn-helix transcriptional regulator n=1 Tax=Sodalis praecaptivus TaxID=1239307 RepID=UPI0035E3D71F
MLKTFQRLKYLLVTALSGEMMNQDHVDRVLEQWRSQRPDLDCLPMGLVGRLARMNNLIGAQVNALHARAGLEPVKFDILATLRRSGEEVTPTRLYQTLMLSSGAMSVRLDKLLARGLIYRQPHEHDRRSCKVGLTDAGLALIDSAMTAHVENEQRLLAPLDMAQRQQLTALLRLWLLANE